MFFEALLQVLQVRLLPDGCWCYHYLLLGKSPCPQGDGSDKDHPTSPMWNLPGLVLPTKLR